MMQYLMVLLGIFCICLIFRAGLRLLRRAGGVKEYRLMGWGLFCGAAALAGAMMVWTGEEWSLKEPCNLFCGAGQLMAAIGITVICMLFYYLFWPQWRQKIEWMHSAVWFSATLHILLCFFPQNRWVYADGTYLWGICRSLPLFFLWVLTAGNMFFSARIKNERWMYVFLPFWIFYFSCFVMVQFFSLHWMVWGEIAAWFFMAGVFCRTTGKISEFLLPWK